ncbi:MAG TPA: EAL domain-containing protein [Methylophilaceae bacterium]|nr:EAL domain-containing protein [Methylophilaceae bacterium]
MLTVKSDMENMQDSALAMTLLNITRDAIAAVGMDGNIQFWNPAAERMFGYQSTDIVGQPWTSVFLADNLAFCDMLWQEAICMGKWEGEIIGRHAKGHLVTALSRWDIERDGAGNAIRVLMVNTSIEQYSRLMGASAQATKQSFEELFGHHPDAVFAFDRESRLISANASLEKLTGYTTQELMSLPLRKMIKKSSLGSLRQGFRKALSGEPQTMEITCLHRDGSEFEASISLLPNIANNAIVGVHGIIRDISDRKISERKVLYLANHDALTGLPNRNLLYDRMQHAIDHARRYKTLVGVLFMDLNRFKIINDSLGHDKGDLLLQTVAQRLKEIVRDEDTVARLGGDEFVIVLEHVRDIEDIARFSNDLLRVVCQPTSLGGVTISVSTSIGACVYPNDGEEPYNLLKNADLAMYTAKELGLGRFCLYKPEMNEKVVDRLSRENGLRLAIESKQLLLHYQPRLNINSNEIVAVEALVRWDHPEKGLIYPTYFIELAEETGMINALGNWVFITACKQLKEWRDAGLQPTKMSINVSVKQLDDDFCDMVTQVLEELGLSPSYIELEITESALMINLDSTYDTLLKLKCMGMTLSIDDFGTGYSSLNYLKRLPIDTLKIDKSFVRDIGDDPDDTAIVNATIAMAHSMELEVVAEGVVTYEQLDFLQNAKCDEIQGYLLCQPLPPAEIETYFRTCELRGIQYSWAH